MGWYIMKPTEAPIERDTGSYRLPKASEAQTVECLVNRLGIFADAHMTTAEDISAALVEYGYAFTDRQLKLLRLHLIRVIGENQHGI